MSDGDDWAGKQGANNDRYCACIDHSGPHDMERHRGLLSFQHASAPFYRHTTSTVASRTGREGSQQHSCFCGKRLALRLLFQMAGKHLRQKLYYQVHTNTYFDRRGKSKLRTWHNPRHKSMTHMSMQLTSVLERLPNLMSGLRLCLPPSPLQRQTMRVATIAAAVLVSNLPATKVRERLF